jgi:hypothetical protein
MTACIILAFFLAGSFAQDSTVKPEKPGKKTVVKKSKKKKASKKQKTIIGIVEKLEEDEEGNITAVSIIQGKKKKITYFVDTDSGKGKDLFALVGKKLRITGIVKKDGDGNRSITVKKYSLHKGKRKARAKAKKAPKK